MCQYPPNSLIGRSPGCLSGFLADCGRLRPDGSVTGSILDAQRSRGSLEQCLGTAKRSLGLGVWKGSEPVGLLGSRIWFTSLTRTFDLSFPEALVVTATFADQHQLLRQVFWA